MGDRANIRFIDREEMEMHEDEGIFLYTHWKGMELPEILRSALIAGKTRWGDPPYLARIIFCEMVDGDVTGETGFGISTMLTDNEHPIIHVNALKQSVHIGDVMWSFEDYVNADADDIRIAYAKG